MGFLLGLAIPLATESTSPALVAGSVIGIAIGTWLLFFARLITVGLALVASVVLTNYFVLDVGFFILPSYFIIVIAFLRLLPSTGHWYYTSPMRRPIQLLLVIAGLSIPVALSLRHRLPQVVGEPRYTSVRLFVQFAALLLMVAAFLLTVRLFSNSAMKYRKALSGLLWVATVVSVYALYQQVAYYADLPLLGVPLTRAGSAAFSPFQSGLIYRSNGTFVEPLNLGHFLVGTLALTLSLMIHGGHIDWPRRLLGVMLALQLVALLFTYSVGSYIAFLFVLSLQLLLTAKRARSLLLYMLMGLGIFASSALLVTTVFGRTEVRPAQVLTSRVAEALSRETLADTATNPYVGYRRVDYWKAALEMARMFPITGVGLGNFGAGAVLINPRLIPNAGSYGAYSGMLGELGYPGLIAFVYLIGVFALHTGRGYVRWGRSYPELLGFLTGFAGMMLQYTASGYLRLDIHVWVFMGLGMVALGLAGSQGNSPHRPRSIESRKRPRLHKPDPRIDMDQRLSAH